MSDRAGGAAAVDVDPEHGTAVVPVLRLEEIHKSFGATAALRGVDFDVRPGEVHALLGENGSGKSTLMSIAYGQQAPSKGRIFVGGRQCRFLSPRAARSAGVSAVAQEVPVVGGLTVGENVLLGSLPRRWGRVDWRAVRRRSAAVLADLGSELSPGRLVADLRPDERQLVAIARAVAVKARVVIVDEPTSSLTAEQAESLFQTLRRLAGLGIGVVFISQRLQEIRRVADRVTVMRDGLIVGTLTAAAASHEAITELMIGTALASAVHRPDRSIGPPVLEVTGLCRKGWFEETSFHVGEREVLGLAGLVGSGRSEVLRAVFGADRPTGGQVAVEGSRVATRGDPSVAIRAGMAMVTGDRRAEGLVLGQSVQHNLTQVHHRRLSLRPIRQRSDRRMATGLVDAFRISPKNVRAPVGQLSGGNQQKVVLAKWLTRPPKVLLLDEPTRGVDVGVKAAIYRIVSELADQGPAVLVSSSEIPELLALCDRILVMREGRLVGELTVTPELSEADVFKLASG